MKKLLAFLLFALLVGCDNNIIGPDMGEKPPIGPKPNLSIVRGFSVTNFIYYEWGEFEIEVNASSGAGIKQVIAENSVGNIRTLRQTSDSRFILDLKNPNTDDENIVITATSNNGQISQKTLNLIVETGDKFLVARRSNKLLQLNSEYIFAITEFPETVEKISPLDNGNYFVDTVTKVYLVSKTGEILSEHPLLGVDAQTKDGRNFVYGRNVEEWNGNLGGQTFVQDIVTGVEKQITFNECVLGKDEPCWRDSGAEVVYGPFVVANISSNGNFVPGERNSYFGIIDTSGPSVVKIIPVPKTNVVYRVTDSDFNSQNVFFTSVKYSGVIEAGFVNMESGEITMFFEGTKEPSVPFPSPTNSSWVVVKHGNDAVVLDSNGNITMRYSFPGFDIENPIAILRR